MLSPVLHKMWDATKVRGHNEILSGEPQPEVDLPQGVEANWMDSDGSAKEGLGVVGVQDALQPGYRAPAHLRERPGWRGRSKARESREEEHKRQRDWGRWRRERRSRRGQAKRK